MCTSKMRIVETMHAPRGEVKFGAWRSCRCGAKTSKLPPSPPELFKIPALAMRAVSPVKTDRL